jgi:hypothetical protein
VALVECQRCGQSVADDAEACPSCGAPDPQEGLGAKRMDFSFDVLLLILGLAVAGDVVFKWLGVI